MVMMNRLQRRLLSAASLLLLLPALSGSAMPVSSPEAPPDSLLLTVPRSIYVKVTDDYDREIPGTSVLISRNNDVGFPCRYDAREHVYRAIVPGDGVITITALAAGFEAQTRTFQGRRLPWPVKIMLGRPGSAHVWINGVRIPYIGFPNEIAVMAHSGWDYVRDSIREAGSKGGGGSEGYIINRTRETYFIDRTSERWLRTRRGFSYTDDLRYLRAVPGVAVAGPIYRKQVDGASIITSQVMVRFWPGTRDQTAREILRLFSLQRVSSMLGSPHSFDATLDPASPIGLDEILEALAVLPEVEAVSQVIMSPIRLD